MDSHGLRVVCDLSDFFSDIRRKLLIYVDPSKDRCVADLVARVKALTGLLEHPNIVLAIGDCLLPMTEDIRVLHQEDILKVINSDTHLSMLETENENSSEICNRKHKDKNRRKKKKLSESESLQIEENVIGNDSEVNVKPCVTDICTTTEVVDPIHAVTNTSTDNSSHRPANLDDSLGETGPNVKRRKRTRVRHRRKPLENNNTPADYSLDTSVGDLEMRSVKVGKPAFHYSSTNQKHIRFLDDSENRIEDKSLESHDLSDKLQSGSGRESVLTPQNEVGANTPNRQLKATQWDIKQHPILINNRETMENGNKLEGTNNMFSKLLALANSKPLVVKHSRPPIAEVKPVPFASTPLQGLPKAGDILTFKILRMDESYCPQLSNLITAKVLLYSEATNEVSLDILDGKDQCQQPRGKFDIETEEEMARQQYSVIQFNWKEIIEPCLNVF